MLSVQKNITNVLYVLNTQTLLSEMFTNKFTTERKWQVKVTSVLLC